MKIRPRLTLWLALLGLLFTAAPAEAGTLYARLDTPFVIGDQLFAGGELQVRPSGHGAGLVALLVDGRQVALLFTTKSGTTPFGSQHFLVFQKDERGLLYLSGMKSTSVASRRGYSLEMNVAALSAGLATVPPLDRLRGESARASR